MVDTRYQDLLADRRPVIEREGTRIDMISGEVGGVAGPALNHWPISGAVITMEPNQNLDHVLPGRDRAGGGGVGPGVSAEAATSCPAR